MTNPKIYLDVQGIQIPFPGAHVFRRLNKNLILHNLPYFEKTGTGGTIGRDLLRTENTFTLEGTWEDDDENNPKYDGWPSFGRYQLIIALAKKKRIQCTFVWLTCTYLVVLKDVEITKHSGQKNYMIYNIQMVRVTEESS